MVASWLAAERMAITVSFFDDTSVPEFREYRGIKHNVFVLEQGWQLPSESEAQRVAQDAFDPHSIFVIARAGGKAIGIARATMISDAFPHAEFFTGQMDREELRAVQSAVATVNAVAVLPEFRGRAVRVDGRAQTMTTGKALMVELTRRLHDKGAVVSLLTTSPGVAAVFFDHLGYYLIGPPFQSGGRTLINMGLGVHDTDHFREMGRGKRVGGGAPLYCLFQRTERVDPAREAYGGVLPQGACRQDSLCRNLLSPSRMTTAAGACQLPR